MTHLRALPKSVILRYVLQVQAGLPIDDNCLFEENEPFSEVKLKISNM